MACCTRPIAPLAMRFEQEIPQTPVTARQNSFQVVLFEIFVLQTDVRLVADGLP